MNKRFIVLAVVLILGVGLFFPDGPFASVNQQKVRNVEVNGDQIVRVSTSIGIATIIQVPDRPNSVVVGDQDSFKVEYLDQAITIKPLVPGASSNLYVYTDWKRFNVELVSGPQSAADYVVYLNLPRKNKMADVPVRWRNFKNSLKNENLSLHIKRVGTAISGLLLAEFTLASRVKQKVSPEWIWLSQNDEVKPIHNLILSGLEVGPNRPVTGLLQLEKKEFLDENVKLELRRKKTSYLTLPGIGTWK